VVVNETATRTIFEGPLSSGKGNITVDNIVFSIAAANRTGHFYTGRQDIDLDLYVDGSIVDSKTLRIDSTNDVSVTFNTNLSVGATAKTIKINASLASNNTGRFVGSVVANGTDGNGNKTQSSPINTVSFRVLSEAGVSVTNAGSTSQVVVEGANAQLTRFTASVQDGTINLENLVISGTSLPGGVTATLNIGGNTYQSTPSASTSEKIVFENINLSLTEKDYDVTVTTNINTDGATTGTKLYVDNVVLTYNGKTSTGDIRAHYYFVKAFPIIGIVSTSTTNQITLRITNGNNSAITLSGLLVTGSSVIIDGQDINTGIVAGWNTLLTPKSLARGESVEVVISANSINILGKLNGIEYTTVNAGETYTYTIDNQTVVYTNIGERGKWKVDYSK
jgi:hypothetical protein